MCHKSNQSFHTAPQIVYSLFFFFASFLNQNLPSGIVPYLLLLTNLVATYLQTMCPTWMCTHPASGPPIARVVTCALWGTDPYAVSSKVSRTASNPPWIENKNDRAGHP